MVYYEFGLALKFRRVRLPRYSQTISCATCHRNVYCLLYDLIEHPPLTLSGGNVEILCELHSAHTCTIHWGIAYCCIVSFALTKHVMCHYSFNTSILRPSTHTFDVPEIVKNMFEGGMSYGVGKHILCFQQCNVT
jgi:hypothetical protein